jgi:hypothetical protein
VQLQKHDISEVSSKMATLCTGWYFTAYLSVSTFLHVSVKRHTQSLLMHLDVSASYHIYIIKGHVRHATTNNKQMKII